MPSDILVQVVSSVLSGGASAATAFAAVFKDITRRLNALEEKLGSDEDPQTGLFLKVERTDETLRALKREVERWQDDPPDWLVRLIRRTITSNSMTFVFSDEQERAMDHRFKSLSSSLARLDNDMKSLSEATEDSVKRHDYDKDLLDRSKELSSIREQIATSNGLLRGIMSALGYIDSQNDKGDD